VRTAHLDHMTTDIHALELKTYAPEEYETANADE
jgi:stress-induced morphogen